MVFSNSMSRLTEKLRLSRITKSTHSFSLSLARFSLSSFRICKSLARLFLVKTLGFFPSIMDDDFLSSSSPDDNILGFDFDFHRPLASSSSSASNNRAVFIDDDHNDHEKLYLVPYRWWREVQTGTHQVGVLYNVSSNNDDDAEIVLELMKADGSRRIDDAQEGVSGQEYALISEITWFRALKWIKDSKEVVEDVSASFVAEYLQDIFPIQIRLSVSGETNSLVVKISLKDNMVAFYRRACNIFGPKSKLLHIWDFSGQITQIFMTDRVNLPNVSLGQLGEEILLELQVYGFSDSSEDRDDKIDEMAEHNKIETSFGTVSVKMNGNSHYVSSHSTLRNSSRTSSSYRGVDLMGLTGLQNLGNTCFMNSAIQCLAHTPKLVDYFLGDYKKEINHENPLGMKGELALAFGGLLRKLWAPGATPVAPKMFKQTLATFANQFSGYNQHDCQEFLAFLLDGLHEDLNRVKCKPYVEAKDTDDHPDKEVSEEYWRNHMARNDSTIVDLCQGQYRSTLVCPHCKKKSVTFDPFMYLSLPLPSTTMRRMTLTVMGADGSTLPSPITVTVPQCGRLKDLVEALSSACSLSNDETLLVAEIYKNKIFNSLEEPSDSLALIRDEDTLVAYRLPKDDKASLLVVFMHEHEEKPFGFGATSNWKLFGIPFVTRLSDLSNGFDLCKHFLKLLKPFVMPIDNALNDYDNVAIIATEDSVMEDVLNPRISDSNAVSDGETEDGQHCNAEFQFYMKDGLRLTEIKMDEPLPIPKSSNLLNVPKSSNSLNVHVFWSEKMVEKYDTCLLSSLPEVSKPQLYTRQPQESVSLYKCLEGFLKEEPLGPEDMWYCPSCKKPRQASKKLDLWRLPEILVVHLKRFSYSRIIKNKLETYVDFPIDDLDLSTYIFHNDSKLSNHYVLYAISNHYGGLGGGHYTAFIDHGHRKWYEFDDEKVFPVSEDRVKTSAAYVLFYRRVS